MSRRRWLFADQLGSHFLDGPDQKVLLVEVEGLFRARRLHRQKAHLILSALRHRAAELGDRALLVRAGTFREALAQVGEELEVCHPQSRAALRFARSVSGVTILPPRGFITTFDEFADWADGNRRGPLRMAEFYRYSLRRHGVLAEPATRRDESMARRGGLAVGSGESTAHRGEPAAGAGGPGRVPPPPAIVEDEIDAQVRRDLDRMASAGVRFVGRDGPRSYPATAVEAERRLQHFIEHRLIGYGRREMMSGDDPLLANSVLSSSFNLGLLDPLAVVRRVEEVAVAGAVPWSAASSFIRQLLGWREFLWQLYWYFEPAYRSPNWLAASEPIPSWFAELDADAVEARCLSSVLAGVRDRAWVNHSQRLLVLNNYSLQRGWRPAELADWFERCFVDGTDWVMNATVIGMSQYADLARIDTRPYAVDGERLDSVGDYCGSCRYRPEHALGEAACPYTAGFAAFSFLKAERLRGTPVFKLAAPRLAEPEQREAVLVQEGRRGSSAP